MSLPASFIPSVSLSTRAFALPLSAPPVGTFAPGTKIQVGSHKVVIDRYLSEGGFAHVYLVKLPRPIDGADVAVLKRVAVPDKEALANMKTEVETMKKLKGHRHIVAYMDSHASQLKGGGYEVFLLMEYCSGGGLIDYMNTRLQNRLTESEVLKIFSDVAEGVACMHYLHPPLMHRDLKVENVLISGLTSSRRYKLCDFGSTAPPRPAAATASECRLIEEDVQKHTTLQYRSPEMIDVYRKQPIDEKSDIWALGVLLYKLCYYTTPFEEHGQLAILNASFKFPGYPAFSDNVKKLIAAMLRESPLLRPNIYQVIREVCALRGTEVPIKDIYSARLKADSLSAPRLPSNDLDRPREITAGAFQSAPVVHQSVVPDIVPMRRGRPSSTANQQAVLRPTPSPLRAKSSDPFAALDSDAGAAALESASTDELSERFPTIDQFTLLHNQGSKFEFDQPRPIATNKPKDLSQMVTEKLADEAFAQAAISEKNTPSTTLKAPGYSLPGLSAQRPSERWLESRQSALLPQHLPQKPIMVSQGTMTSPLPPFPADYSTSKPRPAPTEHFQPSSEPRSSSHPRLAGFEGEDHRQHDHQPQSSTSSQWLDLHRPRSQLIAGRTKSPASTRPSLDVQRPSAADVQESIDRFKFASSRTRPSSENIPTNVGYLQSFKTQERQGAPTSTSTTGPTPLAASGSPENPQEAINVESNVEFLRTIEDEEASRRKEKRGPSGLKHAKRSSLPSISLSNTKNLFVGKFGDAFRRFEGSNSSSGAPQTPSPSVEQDRTILTPIAGSEATGDRSDDEAVDDAHDMSPEMKRELERRRLSQEEHRVAAATAEYRQRITTRDAEYGRGMQSGVGSSRAASIQNTVKSLLSESTQGSKPVETANLPQTAEVAQQYDQNTVKNYGPLLIQRKPIRTDASPMSNGELSTEPFGKISADVSYLEPVQRVIIRPNAPPKPTKLRTGGAQNDPSPASPIKPARLSGRPLQNNTESAAVIEEWERNFTKRYPVLTGIEMVETEIERGRPASSRSKEP
ncbi:MAG: hypothetical protein M1829_000394 [Trizodia sp. TS-e1964]|nr:MAG: hypothetical protein M1829_000394 [Trizodia sp. TS-e1964]